MKHSDQDLMRLLITFGGRPFRSSPTHARQDGKLEPNRPTGGTMQNARTGCNSILTKHCGTRHDQPWSAGTTIAWAYSAGVERPFSPQAPEQHSTVADL